MHMPTDMDILVFARTVDQLARDRKGELYANSGPSHARVVVEKLLDEAESCVDIYAGGLNGKVHDLKTYERLIDRIGADKIRVVLTQEEDSDGVNRDLLEFLKQEKVQIRRFREVGYHLIVVDGKSFRVEEELETMKALFSFGGELPKKFQETFNTIWKKAGEERVA